MPSLAQYAKLCFLIIFSPFLLKIANNANMTLFDRTLTWEDRIISFVLCFPYVLPMASPSVRDDEKGRKEIEAQRKRFNWLVNGDHDKQAKDMNYTFETISILTRDNAHINIILYRPNHLSSASATTATSAAASSTSLSPLYVWIHGGGWVYGEGKDVLLLDSVPPCEVQTSTGAKLNNLVIASIEYRLAPESKFPIATDDTVDALKWLINNADKLKIDKNRVSIGGTSAGGNLAAVLGQRAVEEGIQLKFQAIFLPVVHYGCFTPSCLNHVNVPLLGAQEIVWFHSMYSRSWKDGLHRHYNPLHFNCSQNNDRKSMVKIAPALVVTAAQDAVRDDGADYVHFLRETCGVKVLHEEVPGTHWSFYRPPRNYKVALQQGICT